MGVGVTQFVRGPRRTWLRFGHRIASQFSDPLLMVRALRNAPSFLADYWRYSQLPGAEPLPLLDLQPCLHERTPLHEIDAHYYYVNPWAARRIVAASPRVHVDIGSQIVLSTLLSAVVPVVYIDYRPLHARVSNMSILAGDLVRLPVRTESLQSLSCLHVAEHVGLGRYGEPLDPRGTRSAANELTRVLMPGGNLLFAVPVGRERVAFNAHRIHDPETIVDYFRPLRLREFSGVHDDGSYVESVPLTTFRDSSYACGFFRFSKE